MEQIPKIVGQRLQAVSRVEAHPDANLLTAFAEKSLLPREQGQILEHLAGCVVCREVVAHAQPEEVLERVAVAGMPSSVRRGSWFQETWVRWAALSACVVIVGAVVISHTQFTRSASPVASNNEPTVVAKTETQSAPSALPAEESNKKQSENDAERLKAATSVGAKRDADELSKLNKQHPASVVNSLPGERRQTDTPAVDLEANNNAPAAATGGFSVSRAAAAPVATPQSVLAGQTEDAKASKKEFSADKAMKAPAATNEVAQAQAASPPPVPAAKSAPVLADSQRERSEAGDITTFSKAKDGYLGGASAGSLRAFRIPAPRWQLASDGKLIKSNDLGKSWQTVPVGDNVVFRALCVTEREVWVGGNQGNLFYSSDAGQRWEQVKPAANGQTLNADINTIEFKDPQHGKLTTTDHQTWTTSDGGHAWQIEIR